MPSELLSNPKHRQGVGMRARRSLRGNVAFDPAPNIPTPEAGVKFESDWTAWGYNARQCLSHPLRSSACSGFFIERFGAKTYRFAMRGLNGSFPSALASCVIGILPITVGCASQEIGTDATTAHHEPATQSVSRAIRGDDELAALGPGDNYLRRLYVRTATDAGLKSVRHWPKLQTLDLALGGDVTDEGIVPVARIGTLRSLNLVGCQVTDRTVALLTELPSLQSLCLNATKVTGNGLSRLRRLQILSLRETPLRAGFVRELEALQELENLDLSGSELADDDIESLLKLPKLRVLEIASTRVGRGVRKLANCRQLVALNLADSAFNDEDLAALQNLKLDRLCLVSTQITDKSIPVLQQMTSLRHLWIKDTGITEAGIAELKKVRNDIAIGPDGPNSEFMDYRFDD